MNTTDWTIDGSGGNPIYGTRHDSPLSDGSRPHGIVLMAHGFKGFKDYGMFPWLANQMCSAGYIVHRFNFSHSGMSDDDGPFQSPDLFEQATWNNQVEDLQLISNEFYQPELPLIVFGHSRGGVAILLAIGRGSVHAQGAISLSSPSRCNSLSNDEQKVLLANGRIESPSGRTGQMLYVGKRFLEEQLESPQEHELLELATKIEVPCLLIHGEIDQTVPVEAAKQLDSSIQHSTLNIIDGGDHVFNTANPFPIDSEPSKQLNEVWASIQSWLSRVVKGS